MRVNPDVVARLMDGEAVLVHLGTNRIYTLNSTAARFWELLEGGMDRNEIKRTLLAEFDVDEVGVDEEIDGVVANLEAEGLLVTDART
jgi:hypothetical protein